MASILNTIKKTVGLDPSYKSEFDKDLIVYINTAISLLTQIGVGPAEGYSITGTSEEWSDLLGNDPRLNLVQSYVTLQVKMLFDPPQNSSLFEAMKSQMKELEWRINVTVDPGGIV